MEPALAQPLGGGSSARIDGLEKRFDRYRADERYVASAGESAGESADMSADKSTGKAK